MGFALEGVGLTHANGHVALRQVSLQVAQGECVALIGPSGAGKTTLLSVIGTALAPDAGQLRVLDQPNPARLGSAALRRLRSRIGTVHQAPPLPARQRVVTTVQAGRIGQWPWWKSLASLFYPLDIAGARAALEPLDLSDKLFVRCDQLSGGQLQRAGIARVLYQQPELLLADEPVSALDPALALSTVRLLVQQARSSHCTLVTSLHAVDLALECFDRIVGVRAGELLFDLPATQVTQQHLQELYASEGQELPRLQTPGADSVHAIQATVAVPECH